MPTLNSAKHIAASLDSLTAQTLKDTEIVAADSGSTDGTADVLRSHNVKGLPVRAVSAPGLPPALARNAGIENASGDYIAFCDSDDMMKPDMLKTLYETAAADNADIVVCDFDIVYPGRTIKSFSRLSDEKFELSGGKIADYYYRFCAAPKPNNYVWSRLYKRKFLEDNNLRFPNVRYSEDHLLNLSALFKSPRITHVGKSLYCYVQHEDSAMREHIRRTNHGLLFLDGFKKAAETLADKDSDISEPILAIYAYTRVKSILFYAWQAGLPEAEILGAISVFAADGDVKKSLSCCLERDYIGRYCRIHDFSAEWENAVRTMLRACIDGAAMPDMSGVFA
jgi:glycosyltransferase involved in cell wall biosynthesis